MHRSPQIYAIKLPYLFIYFTELYAGAVEVDVLSVVMAVQFNFIKNRVADEVGGAPICL